MENTYLEEIHGFYSPYEFKRFVKWIENEAVSGFAKEVQVKHPYLCNLQERWFCFDSFGEVWRLVYPDPPFTGYWGKGEPVEAPEIKAIPIIKETLVRMSELLRLFYGSQWADILTNIINNFDSDVPYACCCIKQLYGGMGSLNDIVLYRDGVLLCDESSEFNFLRGKLYELITYYC
ncbi:MAG: hypothetical protein AB9872_13710 [Solidesulfovibrio sp.]